MVATVLGVLILLLVPSLCMVPMVGANSATSPGQINLTWVDQQLTSWNPAFNSSMQYGVLFQPASYDNIIKSYNTPQVENATLSMLLGTGASCIRIDIGHDVWLKNDQAAQSELMSLVSQIKGAGRCLIIADAGAESYRTSPLTWQQFKEAWVQRVQTLASLFKPNYYIVIKEPGFYVGMVSDATTNPLFSSASDWLNLTQTLVSTVHSVSPNTSVGISISSDSISKTPLFYNPYLIGVGNMQGISFVGYDIYTITGFNNTLSFVDSNGSGHAKVWIAECWSGTAASGIFNSSRSTLDVSWMKLVYYFGLLIHASMIIPFFTPIFASYSLASVTSASQALSLLQQRTPVFYEFQAIVASSQAGSTSGSTSGVTTSTGGSVSGTSSTLSTTSSVTTGTRREGSKNQARLIAIALILAVVLVAAVLVFIYRSTRRRR